MAEGIVIPVSADTSLIIEALGKVEKAARDSGQKVQDALDRSVTAPAQKATSAFGGMRTAVLALVSALAAVGIGKLFKESIDAAIESEKAILQFNFALAATGQFSESASAGFRAFATEMQRVAGVQDEIILNGGALLTTIGRLSSQELPRASEAALNLSAGLRITAEQGFDLMSKAAAGNTAALARYGIRVSEEIPKGQRFAEVLRQIEANFGGLARAQGETFGGGLARIQNSFGDILENFGNIITRSPLVIKAMNAVANGLAQVADFLEGVGKRGIDLIRQIAIVVVDLGQSIAKFVVAPLELAFNIGNLLFRTTVESFQRIINLALRGASVITGALAAISDQFAGVNETVQGLTESTGATLAEFDASTQQAATNLFNFDATAATETFLSSVRGFVDTASPRLKEEVKPLAQGVTQPIVEEAGKSGKAAGQAFKDGMVRILAQAFADLGRSLAGGQAQFAQFGKFVLGVFAQMAIQIGSLLISTGIGMIALGELNPFSAIAAGIALVTIGGILSALSEGGGGPAVPAPGTPGDASSGGIGGAAVALNDEQLAAQQAATNVQVVVQGNILDRRQTGLELAEVLQEAFDTQGTLIQTGFAT